MCVTYKIPGMESRKQALGSELSHSFGCDLVYDTRCNIARDIARSMSMAPCVYLWNRCTQCCKIRGGFYFGNIACNGQLFRIAIERPQSRPSCNPISPPDTSADFLSFLGLFRKQRKNNSSSSFSLRHFGLQSTLSKRTLSKPDTSLNRTANLVHSLPNCTCISVTELFLKRTPLKPDSSFGPEGVRFRESWLYIGLVTAPSISPARCAQCCAMCPHRW